MKKVLIFVMLFCIVPAWAGETVLTMHDNRFYTEKDPKSAAAGDLTAISDISYYYNPTNKTLKVTQIEWLADGNGGEYQAPYDSVFNYTDITFDNMCEVLGVSYCDDVIQSKINEMRTQYESSLSGKHPIDKYTLKSANEYTDARVNAMEKKLSSGIASASAMSAVAVSNVSKGEVSVGGGYGYYNSRSAVAFGAAVGVSDNWSVNAAVGLADSNVSCRAGTNYKFKLF